MLNFNFPESHHILWMIFQEKCFSCYILLTDQTSSSDYLYFSRHWGICVLQLFVNHNHFDILRLFDVLPNFAFSTSETMGDYWL